jgi:hypothetical protein
MTSYQSWRGIASFPPSPQVFEIVAPVCKGDFAGFMPFMLTFMAPIDLKVKDIVIVNACTGRVEIVQRCNVVVWRYASRN